MIRTLFAKILLWTVLVQFVAVGAILAVVTLYLPQSEEAVNNAFSLYADTAVALYENFGSDALDRFLARSGEDTLLQLKLIATKAGERCAPSSSGSTSIKAQGRNDAYCLTVHARTGGLPESSETRGFRLEIFVLAELLSCAGLSYFIARYLARPITELRSAAARLARGDLSVRVGARFANRRDEAADLVREFDQMAERFANLIQAQKRLIGDVSHEIKSPLARLSMALGLARRDAEVHAPRQFERMQREIDTISILSRELLTLASLEAGAGAGVPNLDRVDLPALISEVLSDIAFETPGRAEDMLFTPPRQDLTVLGDAALLARAFGNVVRNAVFYTEPGDRIDVACAPCSENRVLVSVADSGPGVPTDALPHLFDPFFRVDDARARTTGGTGIGLAICRRAIELHGGEIRARNQHGGGLLIVMDLPAETA